MDDIAGRILNPVVILTMAAAGVAYARLLWSLNLRPTAVLAIVGIVPGVIYFLTVWVVRAMQGTPSLIWPALMLDWLIFSGTAVATVLVARRHHQ